MSDKSKPLVPAGGRGQSAFRRSEVPVARLATGRSEWVPGHPRDDAGGVRMRLFCFPFAGGSASYYRDWPSFFPPSVQLCPVQLPGREGRWGEPAYTRMGELVEALLTGLHPLMGLPFAFFGHSMGAWVAFELARKLRDESEQGPARLFVSAARAPHLPESGPRLSGLSDAKFVEGIKRLEGLPPEAAQSEEFMSLVVPIIRADVELCESYRFEAGAPLDCPISAYGGVTDPRVRGNQLAAWKVHTRNGFRFRLFAGGHFFLSSVKEQVLAELRAELESLPSRGSG